MRLFNIFKEDKPINTEKRFETFTLLITKIKRNIHKIKSEEMAEFNLKGPHVTYLYYIYKMKSLTAKELCDLTTDDKAAVSRSIDYLEKNEFISCNAKSQKRYRASLVLTEKGEAAAKATADKIDDILGKASEGLTEEKRKIFYESLELVSSNLDKLCSEYEQN